ncbi:hypothetical protein JAAARDRAFT_201090 [Jaapia argillacea MUCL 33604]|uniref:Uncharacterized protein n=1 Tax=Jaapia argillacea MUCL 33604 TaxID=933084 RepID=A0A067PFA1_9AGAM|nr:hypothetical protein JAAARDRAFT_201090 [Jaapia argillacea MUCL 33604]
MRLVFCLITPTPLPSFSTAVVTSILFLVSAARLNVKVQYFVAVGRFSEQTSSLYPICNT